MVPVALLLALPVVLGGCLGTPSHLVVPETSAASRMLVARIHSLTAPEKDAAVVDGSMTIRNAHSRPFVLVPEDISLADEAGTSVQAIRGPRDDSVLPLPLRILSLPFQLVTVLVLAPIAAPVDLIRGILPPSEKREREQNPGTHWIIDPQKELAIEVYFRRADTSAAPSLLRIRDLAAGDTVDVRLYKIRESDD